MKILLLYGPLVLTVLSYVVDCGNTEGEPISLFYILLYKTKQNKNVFKKNSM